LEDEPGRRSAAKLLSKDEARRIAANKKACATGLHSKAAGSSTDGSALSPLACRPLQNGSVREIERIPPATSRGAGCSANSKLAILTFPILAATVVRAFTNARLSEVKLVYPVARPAHHSRRPFRRHITEIITAHLKTALKCSSRFSTREN